MKSDPRLLRILEGWLDGNIPEAEAAELLAQLGSDPELRKELADQIAISGALAAASESQPGWLGIFSDTHEATEQAHHGKSFETATMDQIDPAWKTGPWEKVLRFTPLALAAAIALAIFLNFDRSPTGPSYPPAVSLNPAVPTPVAIVTGSHEESGYRDGTFLGAGIISKRDGWLAIQTLTGVSLTLTAPFKVNLIDPERVHVKEGQIRVFVPEGAEGFVMESPAFKVIDLGTEFATTVNPDGTGSCKVFDGMADVSFVNSLGSASATRRINAGEELEISPAERSMKATEGTGEIYAEMKTPPKPLLSLSPSYFSDVLALGPTDFWRFETITGKNIPNEIDDRPEIVAFGDVAIEPEADGNHSGRLKYKNTGAFVAEYTSPRNLSGDFTVAMFTQFDWLQNYTLFASSRWNDSPDIPRGNQFLFKAYASFEQSGIQGTGLYSVFRDQPAWDGGTEIFGNQLLRPKFWHHVAITRNSSEVIIYLDGIAVAREPVTSIPINFDHLYIGRSDSPNRPPEYLERGLIGNIDEVAIFDRELTPAEIATLAGGKIAP